MFHSSCLIEVTSEKPLDNVDLKIALRSGASVLDGTWPTYGIFSVDFATADCLDAKIFHASSGSPLQSRWKRETPQRRTGAVSTGSYGETAMRSAVMACRKDASSSFVMLWMLRLYRKLSYFPCALSRYLPLSTMVWYNTAMYTPT